MRSERGKVVGGRERERESEPEKDRRTESGKMGGEKKRRNEMTHFYRTQHTHTG